jgi:hypothetical protein
MKEESMKRLLLLLICLTLTAGLMLTCAGEKEEDVEDKTPSTQIEDDDKAGGPSDGGDDETDEDTDSDSLESETEGSED